MSVAATVDHLPSAREAAPGRGQGGPAPTSTIVTYGFWIFLLSDIVLFSALFASYVVLAGNTAGGPGGKQLFNLLRVGIETGCLLLSSFTCGLLTMAAEMRRKPATYAAAAITLVLGGAFLALEITEFADMIGRGYGPSRSAFLSGFFTLVGAHGLHVTAGLIWLVVMVAQVATRGFRPTTMRRLHCFGLFWHTLDIIWVAVFTVVYLMGSIS